MGRGGKVKLSHGNHIECPRIKICPVIQDTMINLFGALTLGVHCSLIFQDQFNGLNFSKWAWDITLSGGGNWQFQLYDNNRSTSYVKDGVLHIEPRLTAERIGENNLRAGFRMDFWGGTQADRCTGNRFYGCERTSDGAHILNPISSALLKTKQTFRYGRFQIRAKLPQGDWLWPAIWLLPKQGAYGEWPASGEIDIMESRGNINYPNQFGGGVNSFGSTLHWGPDFFTNRFNLTHNVYTHPSPLSDDFHVYGLYWDSTKLYTYIDKDENRVLNLTINQTFYDKGKFGEFYNPWADGNTNAPFDQEYYLILNLAVGGTSNYFPEGVAGKPWSNNNEFASRDFWGAKGAWFPTWTKDFQIDYVRIWSVNQTTEQENLHNALAGLMEANGVDNDPLMISNCFDGPTSAKIQTFMTTQITNASKAAMADLQNLPNTVSAFLKNLSDTSKSCFASHPFYAKLKKAYNVSSLAEVGTKFSAYVSKSYTAAHQFAVTLDATVKAGKFQTVGNMLGMFGHNFLDQLGSEEAVAQ